MNSTATLKKFYITLGILLGILLVGVTGYSLIEGYTFLEAFYMTVITLSTVGFSEVAPLSEQGRWFTAFLIITSFGTFAYGFSLLAQAIISGELARHLKRKRLNKTIQNLNNHTVVCGFGRNGRRAYTKLMAYGQEVVVIEKNQNIIETQLKDKNILYIEGDATSDDILREAGVSRARSLVSTLSKDADNLFVVISARTLSKTIRLVSRASNESTETKLRAVGVNSVVKPEAVGGAHMATLVMSPNIVEFMDHISVEGSSAINLEEVEISELTDNQSGCTLNELKIRQRTGCTVIGLKTAEGEYVINPSSDQQLSASSKLFVLGNTDQIKKLSGHFTSKK